MDDSRPKRQTWLICAGLAAAVLIAYWPVWRCGFVAYDDNDYVTANEFVKHGLSWRGVGWAFRTSQGGNWHPLTWLSHMMDCQFYGLNPAGHHATNLALHVANTLLFFLVLQRMTGRRWPSALVTGFFALHPLHVESVAWVSERKDVLSTFFWMLAVAAYVGYVEKGSWRWYSGSLVFFTCGLMAKPMLVSLPLLLILFDFWPLRRVNGPARRWWMEKGPYLALAGIFCLVAILTQQREGTVASLKLVPASMRLNNIPVACVRYIGKTFWPQHLAVLYPLQKWTAGEVVGSLLLLLAITVLAVWRRKAQPYLIVGWLWFLGMLAPVIGVIQIGSQSMADRYSYLSNAGLFLLVIWCGYGRVPFGVWILLLGACIVLTFRQVGYWRESESLFRHTLAITQDNRIIENDLGHVLLQENRLDDALPHVERAVSLAPDYALAHYNLGRIYLARGQVAEALTQFEIQVNLNPNDAIAQFNFGKVLLDHGLPEDALPHLQKAVEIRPDNATYRSELDQAGTVLHSRPK